MAGDSRVSNSPTARATAATPPNTPPYIVTVTFGSGVPPVDVPSPPTPVRAAIRPPAYCANEDDRNHVPIMNPTIFAGESFVIMDRPMGERHNSPVV